MTAILPPPTAEEHPAVSTHDQPLVLPFSHPRCREVELTGGKGASLATMTAEELPVPPGFVITSAAFAAAVDEEALREAMRRKDVEAGRALVAAAAPPRELIEREFAKLQGLVAVRSSACAEDSEGASYAGQQETFLNTDGLEAVLHNVVECWLSFFTDRAVFYRQEKGSLEDVAMAVVVQQMIDSQKSGVLFTVDPVHGRRDRMVVEAAPGLGEAVVSGEVTPDNYTLSRQGVVKKAKVVHAEPVLTDEECAALARMGQKLADLHGVPQDIEWAFDAADDLYLLQSRPITTVWAPARPGAPQTSAAVPPAEHCPSTPTNHEQGAHDVTWMAPRTVAEAVELKAAHPDATVVAGGTFVGILTRQGLLSSEDWISLQNVRELRQIDSSAELALGAMVTHRRIELHPDVATGWPGLRQVFAVVASPRVRNAATVGGVLGDADYASDPPAMLVACGAWVEALSIRGLRRIPVADLILDHYETSLAEDELITRVLVPRGRNHTTYRKLRTRSQEDRPSVAVAAALHDGTVSVVVGAVSGRPQSFPDLCATWVPGQDGSDRAIAEGYADRIEPISDNRGTAAYRTRAIAVEVRRALEDLTPAALTARKAVA